MITVPPPRHITAAASLAGIRAHGDHDQSSHGRGGGDRPREGGRFVKTGAGGLKALEGRVLATYSATKQLIESGELTGMSVQKSADRIIDELSKNGQLAGLKNGDTDKVRAHLAEILSEKRLTGIHPLTPEQKTAVLDERSVRSAAEKHGVTPDELRAAIPAVAQIRAEIRDEAREAKRQAFHILDSAGALRVARPPKDGKGGKGGEYDFMEGLTPQEQNRLSSGFSGESGPDQIADALRTAGVAPSGMNDSEVMAEVWLPLNRTITMGGAVSVGRVPADRQYSGNVDIDGLAPTMKDRGYSPDNIFRSENIHDAAGHIARVTKETAEGDAWRDLGQASSPVNGPAAWQMSPSSFENEVRDIEYTLKNSTDRGELQQAQARHRELVPHDLDEPDLQYKELHERVIRAAKMAGIGR